jgi:hypothetical protein
MFKRCKDSIRVNSGYHIIIIIVNKKKNEMKFLFLFWNSAFPVKIPKDFFLKSVFGVLLLFFLKKVQKKMTFVRRYLFTFVCAGISILCFLATALFWVFVVQSMYNLGSGGQKLDLDQGTPLVLNGTVTGDDIQWFNWEYDDNTEEYPTKMGEPVLNICLNSSGILVYTGAGNTFPTLPNPLINSTVGGCMYLTVNDGCTQQTAFIGVQSLSGNQKDFQLTVTLGKSVNLLLFRN